MPSAIAIVFRNTKKVYWNMYNAIVLNLCRRLGNVYQ